MTSPLSGASPAPAPAFQLAAHQQEKINFQGFTISQDKKSAEKVFVVDNKELKITVYFPSNINDDAARAKRLEQFSDGHLRELGKYAIDLGLGNKKKTGILDAISFKHDSKGELTEVEKRFSNKQVKVIKVEEYANKVKEKIERIQADAKIPEPERKAKKEKLERKIESLKKISNSWKSHFEKEKVKDVEDVKEEFAEEEEKAAKEEDASNAEGSVFIQTHSSLSSQDPKEKTGSNDSNSVQEDLENSSNQ